MDETGGVISTQVIEMFAPELSRRPPSILYHYTSPEGLHGIVESREIWATNIHYLNDESEFHHALGIASAEVELAKKKVSNNLDVCVLSQMQEVGLRKDYRQLFVASFSEKGDLLSQWRAYCPNGGCSIGFVGTALARKDDPTFRLWPCMYELESQKETVRNVIEWCLSEFRNAHVCGSNRHRKQRVQQTANHFRLIMSEVAPLLKHPEFSEEREWRLIGGGQTKNALAFR